MKLTQLALAALTCCGLSVGLVKAELPPSESAPEPLDRQQQQQQQLIDPLMERLQSLQSMRLLLEQDWAGYLDAARSNTRVLPIPPAGSADVRQMRQEVTHNLERMEDRFRCLDVDLNGNNGNVVLVCGDNNGGIATNNQQALGADLNISGGGL